MKPLIAAAIALSLAGCASAPRPQMMMAMPSHTKSVKAIHQMPQAMPTVVPAQTTPNAVVKKRWWNRFKTHPRWFH